MFEKIVTRNYICMFEKMITRKLYMFEKWLKGSQVEPALYRFQQFCRVGLRQLAQLEPGIQL